MNDTSNTTRHRQLVGQLGDPRTRRDARQKLVAERAVQPLLECLGTRNESVLWAAIQSLGELRAREAIGPLVDLLEKGTLPFDVSEALTNITGQNFGTDAKRWRQWLDSPAMRNEVQFDASECIHRTGEFLGVQAIGSGTSYQFTLSTAEGRSQRVSVFFRRREGDEEDLVVIYSECGPAKESLYESVLRKNLGIAAGAFAIRDIDGKPCFVMVDAIPASSVTPGLLARKIENLGLCADSVEKSLTKADRR